MTIDPAGTLMAAEAAEAPDVVARQRRANADALAQVVVRLRERPPTLIATIARGSSDHATTYLRYLAETRLKLPALSLAPSIVSVYGVSPDLRGALAITVSQSGSSPDILASVAGAAQAGAETLALVNVEGSPLARAAKTVLPLHAGPERSVAATKSAIATLAQLAALVAAWGGDVGLDAAVASLPDMLHEAWDCDWSPLVDALRDANGLFVIGRGPALGIAQEMALKLKETCGLHAEAFSAAEVRHGPMALIGPGFPVLILRQDDDAASGLDSLAADLAARGGPVLVAGGAGHPGVTPLPAPAVHPVAQPIVHLLAFYRAANALAIARGHDPDRPPYLAKVTETI